MNPKDFVDVGFGLAALFVVFKLGGSFLDGYFKEKAAERAAREDSRESEGRCDPNILEVIQNNTRVMDKLSELMQKIITSQKQQDVKIDELLARAREHK